MSELSSAQVTKQRISELLDALSPESLRSVEDFVRFLLQQGPFALGPRYPTVENQASSFGRRSDNLSLIEAEVSFTVIGEDW